MEYYENDNVKPNIFMQVTKPIFHILEHRIFMNI